MSSVNFEGEEFSWVFARLNTILRTNKENWRKEQKFEL